MLANKALDAAQVIDHSIIQAAVKLNNCYQNLAKYSYNRDNLAENCRKFCSLISALEDISTLFPVLPKLHLFQELCSFGDLSPSLTWCYRDEEFGGSLAALSRVRGGANRAAATANTMLQKFMCAHRLPKL